MYQQHGGGVTQDDNSRESFSRVDTKEDIPEKACRKTYDRPFLLEEKVITKIIHKNDNNERHLKQNAEPRGTDS